MTVVCFHSIQQKIEQVCQQNILNKAINLEQNYMLFRLNRINFKNYFTPNHNYIIIIRLPCKITNY